METSRRGFLLGAAAAGTAVAAAGCLSAKGAGAATGGGSMQGFAAPAIPHIRVGVVGLGMRGMGAVHRLSSIPGVQVVALCDLFKERVGLQQAWLKKNGKPPAREYTGNDGWQAMCQSDLDLVYNVTNWQMHVPIALEAMKCGKHTAIEVPAALTLDDCWALVETAEKTRRHCMQLENCCYGETEMLALNLCRLGILGELVHGEGAYIHDLRSLCYGKMDLLNPLGDDDEGCGYWDYWRLRWNKDHKGNQYETHGLGPICEYMDINRGDRFDYLASIESRQASFEDYGQKHFGADSWQGKLKVQMGDMNTTVIRTVKGRSIMIQHDVSNPRPYSRINTISGTKGILADYPYRVGWEDVPGKGVHQFFPEAKAEEIRKKYMHPLWKRAGEIAKKIGGHGGMDFLMDLRLAYCLESGLPLDTDVCDLAAWCSLAECTERSVRERRFVELPDFTRGGWQTAKPLGIVDVDLKKMGLDEKSIKKDENALSV